MRELLRVQAAGRPKLGALRRTDALTPLLDKAAQADVLLLGSPIYFGTESGLMRAREGARPAGEKREEGGAP